MDLGIPFGKLDPDPHKKESRNRIRIDVKIQELYRLKMEPRGAMDTQNGAVEGL
jgi:hypothetical protein